MKRQVRIVLASILALLIGIAGRICAEKIETLEFTGVDSFQIIQGEGVVVITDGKEIVIPASKGEEEYVILTLDMKGKGEEKVVLNSNLIMASTPIRQPYGHLGPQPERPKPNPSKPQTETDTEAKYKINFAEKDLAFIIQKLKEFNLSQREIELIGKWLTTHDLKNYTMLDIRYDEEENLVLKMSGPGTQSSVKFEKRIIQHTLVQIWKPAPSPNLDNLAVTFDPKILPPKFELPPTTPISEEVQTSSVLQGTGPIEYAPKTTVPPKLELPPTSPISEGKEEQEEQ